MASLEKTLERFVTWVVNSQPRRSQSIFRDRHTGCGFVLDRVGKPVESYYITPSDRLRHLYILGSTGSGKTNLLSQLIATDIESRISTVVIDYRGDFVDRITREFADLLVPESVQLIDLRRPQLSSGINPFQSSSDPYNAALQIHSILRSSADSWGVQLDETIRCSLIALSYARTSMAELPRLLVDAQFRAAILARTQDEQVIAFFSRFEGISSDRQSAWTLPVLNKISPFLCHPSIRAILGEQPPLDLVRVLNEPGSLILVALAADRMHGLAGTFGCLVVNAVENAVMSRVDTPEDERNPVHFYLDEFENFQSPAFESIIAEGRRFRLGLTLSHQNLHQLDTKLRHTITNNAATRVYFRTGHVDSKELGSELEAFGIKNAARRLMHLPVGQAFVVDAGSSARHIGFHKAERRPVSREANAAILEALETRAGAIAQPSESASPKGVKHIRKPRAAQRKEKSDAS